MNLVDLDRRFGGLKRLYGVEPAQRIAQSHVMVVGVGGVGSWAVEALARSGVHRLTLVDMDHVAESNINRQLGCDVIGMTSLPEAKLCREAEIAMATLALVTDYDCWKEDEAAVDVATVIANLHANSSLAKDILHSLIPALPIVPDWPEHRSLDGAILTPAVNWPSKTARKLNPMLGRFL
jgi:shikimate 5-dehydrogenase